jgi:hypothetical protein
MVLLLVHYYGSKQSLQMNQSNSGNDMIPRQKPDVPIEQIIDTYKKYTWLKKLQDSSISKEEKLDLIKNEIVTEYQPISITAGGLMNDWDFDITM